ncbi:MAG: DNA-binding protein [Proteobacteria bacterium]|nr:DNA-binding protein [Pseudomonadota bacterium]MBU4013440.1 DNA-binding protein [Pseudomonadota bacterium]MBU4068748.1 DNA-binding protein [Pseudomonadota bacterium]MBU4100468.1 DNA-binding protein [Pseudomonadota bacterium]MBU4126680.1 DNA-binding protein [Pseudomonadota bacterium]
MSLSEFKLGRFFLGSLPYGKDLIESVEDFCKEASIQMAVFSAIGSVSSVTLGCYDQKQQVYVTFSEEAPLEIIACIGNVSVKEGSPFVHAHIVLSDEKGKITGGHLFSETIIFAGEINLQELTGKPFERAYDNKTGLMLWNLSFV